jgi:hypothetical protein
VLVMALPLAIGLGLAGLAARRGWAPGLAVTMCAGASLRLVVMLIAAQDSWQPYDLADDFLKTADYVLDGRDPLLALLEIREGGGWHFLPFMAYLLAGERELGLVLGLPWEFTARLGPVLADLALIPLVGKLATERRELRSFQYACVPPALMISGIHGQFVPITLLFGVAALLAARRQRGWLAGLCIGLSVTATTWSVLLLPGVLKSVRGLRSRLTVLGLTGAVPLAFLLSGPLVLDTPLSRLPDSIKTIISARPVVGDWGWTALVTGGEQQVSPALSRVGSLVLLTAVIAAWWWWRRADPLDLTIALLLVFIVVTYRFGSQYLVWALPFLIARPTRGTWPAIIVASGWAAFGYLYMTRLNYIAWGETHTWWALSSPIVIAMLIWALPWRRRTVPESGEISAIRQPAPT